MVSRTDVKKAVLVIAATLGTIGGLFGFGVTFAKTHEAGYQIPLSIVVGITYFGIFFSSVAAFYKVLKWVSEGFHIDCAGEPLNKNEPRNLRQGCRRIALAVAVLAGVLCASYAASIPPNQYVIAKKDLSILENQHQDYRGKAYYDYMQRERLKDNYWLNLPIGALVGLSISAGIAGAVAGFVVLWVLYRFFEQLVVNILGGER